MIVNPLLVEAAHAVVRGGYQDGALLQVDGYPGMFVAESGNPQMHSLHFFSEGDRRFALGPLLKAERRVQD